MAQTFLKTDGDIRAVLRPCSNRRNSGRKAPTVEDEVAARSGGERGAREQRECGFRRGAGQPGGQLGEPLYRKIEPTGYSNSSREWMNTAGLMARMNFAVQLSGNKVPGVTVENGLQDGHRAGLAGVSKALEVGQ
jgi:uncharacterized protein (DUF1800 family)